MRAGGLTPVIATAPAESLLAKEMKEPIELTQEGLEKLWAECAETLRENTKLHAAMQDRRLVLRDQNNFDIVLSNLHQESELSPFKVHILTALREASGHPLLQWRITVERQQTEHVAYQPLEKYQVMHQANPAIEKFKQLFPDIDY